MKRIINWDEVCLFDEHPDLHQRLLYHRGGCSCHSYPPCYACSEPITDAEIAMLEAWIDDEDDSFVTKVKSYLGEEVDFDELKASYGITDESPIVVTEVLDSNPAHATSSNPTPKPDYMKAARDLAGA